jgi:D-lactate dehydrogenase (cytochrome)
MRENVLNVTAVLPDGTVIKTGSRARKSSAGYDLTRLLIGSEGTLAVITEVTLKLHGIPKYAYAVRIAFPSIEAAAATARDTLNCGVTVDRCELLDELMVKVVNDTTFTENREQAWPEVNTLMYELTGPSHQSVMEQLQVR